MSCPYKGRRISVFLYVTSITDHNMLLAPIIHNRNTEMQYFIVYYSLCMHITAKRVSDNATSNLSIRHAKSCF